MTRIFEDDKEAKFYHAWFDMKTRCNNPNCKAYKNYGGRGIKYCKAWEKYENFKDDLYKNFREHAEKHFYINDKGEIKYDSSLDRIDPNGNYEPSNCRWATNSQQSANIRGKSQYKGINLLTGETVIFVNRTKFCRDNGFANSGVTKCIYEGRTNHKGWAFRLLDESEYLNSIEDKEADVKAVPNKNRVSDVAAKKLLEKWKAEGRF